MSKYLSEKYNSLSPYVPGEQPKGKEYIKLNTNESPFPPSPYAQKLAREAAGDLQLYSDPTCSFLSSVAAEKMNIAKNRILFTNGSDEALLFAFKAFCDEKTPAAFPDVTYGFYKVFAKSNGIPYEEKALKDDFTVDVNDYIGIGKTVFLANPNAQTGVFLPLSEIEKILTSNPKNVVVIDEAYIDFGGESAIPLTEKYDNLLVVQTFSKSRSLAGGRLGIAVGNENLIEDLNKMKYSINPYNVNRMTMAAGVGALVDEEYFSNNCKIIRENRKFTKEALVGLGFTVTDSVANFILAKSDRIGGEELYLKLKEQGILVRHFPEKRLDDYIRITIGNKEQMKAFIDALEKIL